jgi:hypothetical protein
VVGIGVEVVVVVEVGGRRERDGIDNGDELGVVLVS